MSFDQHPHDELLAALAGADADAAADRALSAHLQGCARCRELLRELSELRLSLAALPDLAPPPGLRAWTPPYVAAPRAPAAGFLDVFRRALAPAMVVGASLLLAAGVGLSGLLDPGQVAFDDDSSGGGAAGAAPAERQMEAAAPDESAAGEEGEDAAALLASPSADGDTTLDQAQDPEAGRLTSSPTLDRTLWLLLGAAGAVLLLAALVGRLSLRGLRR